MGSGGTMGYLKRVGQGVTKALGSKKDSSGGDSGGDGFAKIAGQATKKIEDIVKGSKKKSSKPYNSQKADDYG